MAGADQTAPIGTELDPLVVRLWSLGRSHVANESVTFTITAGDGSLSSSTAITNDVGVARTTLTLGSTPGEVRVEASIGDVTALFVATALP